MKRINITKKLNLSNFTGTEHYYNVLGTNVTDGINYIMNNGYSWFVTDQLINCKAMKKLKGEDFLSIKLKINEDQSAEATISDGDDKILNVQKYIFTNCITNISLYFTNNTLLLINEY